MRGARLSPVVAVLAGLGLGACSAGSANSGVAEKPEGDWRPLFLGDRPDVTTTSEEHANYHLRVEFRRTRRASLSGSPGTSGILYHLVGDGQGDGGAEALGLRVEQGSCGDFFGGHNVVADVEGVRQDEASGRGPVVYRRGRGHFTVGRGTPLGNRTVASEDAERPVGGWNVLELVAVGRTSVHLVNGRPVMVLDNLRRQIAGREVPLTRGRIRLVSAGPDLIFRDPQLRSLDEIPAGYLPAAGAR